MANRGKQYNNDIHGKRQWLIQRREYDLQCHRIKRFKRKCWGSGGLNIAFFLFKLIQISLQILNQMFYGAYRQQQNSVKLYRESKNFCIRMHTNTCIHIHTYIWGYNIYGYLGFSGGTVRKNPSANAGDARDTGSIPGSGTFPGVRNGTPLQYSYLENPMDRGHH